MKTTRRYPLTREECEERIRGATEWCEATGRGGNRAHGDLSFRGGTLPSSEAYGAPGGLIAFSFVESRRTPGAYREIPFAS